MDTTPPARPPRSRQGDRLSRFVFTLNNPTEEEYTTLMETLPAKARWMVMAKEHEAEGTPHLQGAVCLKVQTAWSAIKKWPGFTRVHFETMRGSPEQSLTYCSKEDKAPFIHGDLPKQGKRTDVANAVARIQQGQSVKDLAKDEEGGIAVVKFHKGLTVLRSLLTPVRTEPPRVIWIHGPTGTGKTRCALGSGAILAEQLGFPADSVWLSSGSFRWFNGYDGQCVAVLDDFRAKQLTGAGGFPFFLRLLDRYPMDVEFKGGFVAWVPRVIFVTCPYSPAVAFSKRQEHIPEDIAQLDRRITSVHHFEYTDDASWEQYKRDIVPVPASAPPLEDADSDLELLGSSSSGE